MKGQMEAMEAALKRLQDAQMEASEAVCKQLKVSIRDQGEVMQVSIAGLQVALRNQLKALQAEMKASLKAIQGEAYVPGSLAGCYDRMDKAASKLEVLERRLERLTYDKADAQRPCSFDFSVVIVAVIVVFVAGTLMAKAIHRNPHFDHLYRNSNGEGDAWHRLRH